MKTLNLLTVSLFILMLCACNQTQSESTIQNETRLFSKGEGREGSNYSGTTYRVGLVDNIEAFDLTVGSVTFDPGVRTNWHSHTDGQILIVISGNGYFQEKGKPIQLIQPGNVVEILPDVVHWHGANPDGEMTHMTVRPKAGVNEAIWLKPVTDEEYDSYFK